MTTIMTPSEMTEKQINKAVANYRAMLEKHAPTFESGAVQTVLGNTEFAGEQFDLFRRRVEVQSDLVVRHFKLDKTKTREQMVAALGRVPYVDANILATMPLDGPEEGDLVFFPLKRYTPVAEIARVFEERGLVPHYAAQMQVNAGDSSFADEHPNGMQWDKNSYAAFRRWDDERRVDVRRHDGDWNDFWWFAGVRK